MSLFYMHQNRWVLYYQRVIAWAGRLRHTLLVLERDSHIYLRLAANHLCINRVMLHSQFRWHYALTIVAFIGVTALTYEVLSDLTRRLVIIHSPR